MTASANSLVDLLIRLANRDALRSEADVQADVRQLLLTAPLQLDEDEVEAVRLETPLGDRRRIDVEVGSTVIEVKRDLRRGRVKNDALEQLAGYVETKMRNMGRRYVGVLTDGAEWICYNLVASELLEVSSINIVNEKSDLDRLIFWLEGVLATTKGIKPTADAINSRLGASSSAYALDRSTLVALFQRNKSKPTVQMKRALWSRLLTSALGTQFEDNDELFVEHTLLVNSAEIIAHAVLGLVVEELNPASLLSGSKFDESGIHGVVEQDFFGWVLEVEEGEAFVRTLARRLARFDWSAVEQDVLKVLYESVIGKDTRKRLGEYYTPDWLAEAIVDEIVTDPLNSRILDNACGSGTFLFHAIKKYIKCAEADNQDVADVIDGITRHVVGMDLHPVAVTLARVTYLLAIGRERLTHPSRGTIQVPVYLGDSIQWREQQLDLWTAGNLVIHADDSRELFASELRFPDSLLEDAAAFDQLVNELAARASRKLPRAAVPSLAAVFKRHTIPDELRPTLEATFRTMCRLHDEGRDHIWGYYVRNLARPVWLARESNRVDVLIGNPPWLAYRHMTSDMQKVFRKMSDIRGLWHGAEVATQQDLSALFVTRSIQLYLRSNGKFAFVMPNAAVDRGHYRGFREGAYSSEIETVNVAFDKAWDLRRIRPHLFPRGACVVFGHRSESPLPMGDQMVTFKGRIGRDSKNWGEVRTDLTISSGRATRLSKTNASPYKDRFYNGATVFPRLLFLVKRKTDNPLGIPAGRVAVRSSRSVNEKKPWKEMPSLEGVVESEFLRPIVLAECLLPFKVMDLPEAVIPWEGRRLLNGADGSIDAHPGLSQWWHQVSAIWEAHRANDQLSLEGRIDYMSNLSKQFPTPAMRVIYNKSGMHVVASKLKDRRAIVENGLYWTTIRSELEGDFICGILNSSKLTELVRPLMSYGKDERDIAKHIWQLPIPQFEVTNPLHAELAELSRRAEKLIADSEIQASLHFSASRRHIREKLQQSGIGKQLDQVVDKLITRTLS